MSGVDPIRLAQFFALPGADRLVEAWAHLPPGRLRESAIAHVEAMAEQFGWTGQGPPVDEAVGAAAINGHQAVGRVILPRPPNSPQRQGLISTSPEGRWVERALRGEKPHQIADSEPGLHLGTVVAALRRAEREGGFKIDVLHPKGEAEPAKDKGAGAVERAAAAKGLSVEEYGQWQKGIVARWLAGEPPSQIADALGEDVRLIQNIVGRRHRIEQRFGPVVEAPPHWALSDAPITNRTIQKAAAARGLSPEDYRAKVRRCMNLRADGIAPMQIADLLGEPKFWVYTVSTGTQIEALRQRRASRNSIVEPEGEQPNV